MGLCWARGGSWLRPSTFGYARPSWPLSIVTFMVPTLPTCAPIIATLNCEDCWLSVRHSVGPALEFTPGSLTFGNLGNFLNFGN